MTDVPAQPRLTVGIPTYNGRKLLEVVLPSLRRQTFRDFRVLVIDDFSSDDTVAWLAEHWPEVEVIVHTSNHGVTVALNSCITADRAELLALLNNDVELDPNCLGELVAALDEHPEAGVACAKLLKYGNRDRLDGAGDDFSWEGRAKRRGKGKRDAPRYNQPGEVFSACAAAAIYRRTALDAVGPFDERFFCYYEDVDWGFRAQLSGWSCRYVPTAIAYHMSNATLRREVRNFRVYYGWRNSLWVVAKNYPAWALVRHTPELLWSQIRRLRAAVRTRRLSLWLRVWRDVIMGLPPLLADRRRIQASRTKSLAELDRLMGFDRQP